jgi:hypothetical protein
MNYAFNRIKFNRQVVSCIAKAGKKKYNYINKRTFVSQNTGSNPNNNPIPLIAILTVLGLYHQYQNKIK